MALLIANDYLKSPSGKHLVSFSESLAYRMKVYLTAVDGDDSDREKAKHQSPLELVTPKVDSSLPKEDPNSKWLILHESYFPQLSSLSDIRLVLGFFPATVKAAYRIWNTESNRNLPLIICFTAIVEDDPVGSSQFKECFEICKQHATAFVSLGLRVHDHYIGQFPEGAGNRAHFCYLPSYNLERLNSPQSASALPNQGGEIHLLTPVFDTVRTTASQVTESLQWKILSLAVGMMANAYEAFEEDKTIVWTVYGIHPQHIGEVQKFLKHQCDTTFLQIEVMPSSNDDHLDDYIKQSLLCLACLHTESNDFVCTRVLSHCTPSLFSERSNYGCLIKRHFRQWSDTLLVGFPTNCNSDVVMKASAKEIKKKMMGIIKNPDIAFKRMKDFRNDFLECIKNGEIGESQRNFYSWCSQQGVKQVDESRNAAANKTSTKRRLEGEQAPSKVFAAAQMITTHSTGEGAHLPVRVPMPGTVTRTMYETAYAIKVPIDLTYSHRERVTDMKLEKANDLLTSDLMKSASQSQESRELWDNTVELFKEYCALIDETIEIGCVLILLRFLTIFHLEYFWANFFNGQLHRSLHKVWVAGHLGSIVEDKGQHISLRIKLGPEDYRKGRHFFQTRKEAGSKDIVWYNLDVKLREKPQPNRPSLKTVEQLGLMSTPMSVTQQLRLAYDMFQNNALYKVTNTALKVHLDHSKRKFHRLISHIGQTNMRPGYYSEQLDSVTWEVPLKYHIDHHLPGSKYWVECRATNKLTQEKVSIKRFQRPFYNSSKAVHTLDIIRLHQALRHPNVCRFLELFTPQWANNFYKVYMVTSALEFNLERALKAELTIEGIKNIMYQVFCGLGYLHSIGVIHRDLQPSAIGIDSHGNVQITDLSSVRLTELEKDFDQEFLTAREKKYCYKAPEIILDQNNYTAAVDVWAAGCIMAEMILGRVFLNGQTQFEQLDLIIETLGNPSKHFLDEVTADVRSYILEKDNFSRANFSQIFGNQSADNLNGSTEAANVVDSTVADLLNRIFVWDQRISVKSVLAHPFFELYASPEDEPAPALFITAGNTKLDRLSLDLLKDIIYKCSNV